MRKRPISVRRGGGSVGVCRGGYAMAWFKKEKAVEPPPPRSKGAEGMWLKCNHCREIIYRKEVERNNKVCPKCEYHFRSRSPSGLRC